MDNAEELQTALIAALESATSVPVWDAVPQGSDYPYITLDSMMSQPEDFHTLRVDTSFFYLGIFSRAYGQAEVMGIIKQINTLHEQPLSLSSGTVVSVRVKRRCLYRQHRYRTHAGWL